jgi:hypothetical protein
MYSVDPITYHGDFINRLGAPLPKELDRLALSQAMGMATTGTHEIPFRFSYRDVPFDGRIVRRDADAVLVLTGDLGIVPYTIQAAQRRRRALRAIAFAAHETGLDWSLSEKQGITVSCEVALKRPLTPSAMVVGALGVLLRCDPYLKLLLDVLGAADYLGSSAAA